MALQAIVIIMNVLAVQNPCHKCDLGNKNDSVTDKKITADYILTIIILSMCVCVCITTYTPSPASIRLEAQH